MKESILVAIILVMSALTPVMAKQIDEKDVPANIRAVIKEKSDGGQISLWVRDKVRSKYIGSVAMKNIARIIEVGYDGKWIATTDALSEVDVPDVIMRSIRSNYIQRGFEADNYLFVRNHQEGSYYAVDVSSDDRDLHVKFDLKGKTLSEEER